MDRNALESALDTMVEPVPSRVEGEICVAGKIWRLTYFVKYYAFINVASADAREAADLALLWLRACEATRGFSPAELWDHVRRTPALVRYTLWSVAEVNRARFMTGVGYR